MSSTQIRTVQSELNQFQAISLDHPEANTVVLKYFLDLVRVGYTKEDRTDFKERNSFVNRFKHDYGAKLVRDHS